MPITNPPIVQDASGLSLPWYAIYTRHQHEKVISQILTAKGLEVFLPLYNSTRRWKDRTVHLSLPLFPCYLFLRGMEERRLDVVTTPGIVSVLSVNGEPAVIPESEVEAVRKAIEWGNRVEPHPFLRVGDRVRVISGPLQGLEGILVRKKNLCRLVLSVELLERSASVEVDVSSVERVASARHTSPWGREPGIGDW
ncbi:MAG TPA: UpxY family transcription antiterminator [Terriglobia bacterium]|nr:UpxY family transcription antiterminator [Terriglobia bacterium]